MYIITKQDDLKITAPCKNCLLLWGSSSNNNFQQKILRCTFEKNSEKIYLSKDDSSCCIGNFYPHPFCGKFHKNDPTSVLEDHIFSPIKIIYEKKHIPKLPFITISVSTPPYSTKTFSNLIGRGVDFDRKISKLKSKMESLERFCALLPPRANLYWGTYRDFKTQTPIKLKSKFDKKRWWCEANLAFSSETTLIPLEYFILNSVCNIKHPLIKRDSSGSFVHENFNEGLLLGILEIWEKYSMRKLCSSHITEILDVRNLSDDIDNYLDFFTHFDYQTFVIPYEPFPNIFFILILIYKKNNAENTPSLIVGSGISTNISHAVHKAFSETFGQFIHAMEIYPYFSRNYDSSNHFIYYFNKKNAHKLILNWGLEKSTMTRITDKGDNSFDKNIVKENASQCFYVDKGNKLTDFLNLSSYQVTIPNLPTLQHHTLCPGDVLNPFE